MQKKMKEKEPEPLLDWEMGAAKCLCLLGRGPEGKKGPVLYLFNLLDKRASTIGEDKEDEDGKRQQRPEMQVITPTESIRRPEYFNTSVVVGSVLYTLGGMLEDPENEQEDPESEQELSFHNQVFLFDTNHPKEGWITGPDMLNYRCSCNAVAVGSKIYVFGGNNKTVEDKNSTTRPWAEFLDPENNKWEPLPALPDDSLMHDLVYKPVVYGDPSEGPGKGKKIILSCRGYIYDVDTQTWEKFSPPEEMRNFSCNLTSVGNILYWTTFGLLYSFDMKTRDVDRGLVEGYKLSEYEEQFLTEPTLLHLEGDHFCFIGHIDLPKGRTQVCYTKFQVSRQGWFKASVEWCNTCIIDCPVDIDWCNAFVLQNQTVNTVNGTDNEVRGGKDTRNNNDVRGGNDTSNNDVRAQECSSLLEDVTMLSFDNCDIASKVCKFYKDLDYPSIPKVIAKVDDAIVAVEKISQVPIMEWLVNSGPEKRMWTVDSSETQCLELEGRYSNIFRCIVATLSYLHSRGKCHGNLKRGIFVTGPTPRVCIANFNVDIGFDEGFKNDLEDLKSLMETAVEYSQPIIINQLVLPKPPALDAFYDLFSKMNQLNQFQIRDFATFIYWAPIFYNWQDRRDFLNIVKKFSSQDIQMFRFELVYDRGHRGSRRLKHAIPSMTGWANRVPRSPINPLRTIYEFDQKSAAVYNNSGGIYQFHLNCLHHYVGTVDKDCDQRAMEDLLNVFPDALPAIFKALIDKFHHQNHHMFRKRLTTFLTEDKKEWRDDWS